MKLSNRPWFAVAGLLLAPLLAIGLAGCSSYQPRLNELQFVGSHNSYKLAMSTDNAKALQARNPEAWAALDYEHVPLAEQLDLGMRKLELDVFYEPKTSSFVVGHVQTIDMRSHCAELAQCLTQLINWSDQHPTHAPIWVSINAKDQAITGLPTPAAFDAAAFKALDAQLDATLANRLIRPQDVQGLSWPTLSAAQGKFLFILDEQGGKRELYLKGWQDRPMFTNSPAGHPAAAVMIINDPLAQAATIRRMVQQGYLVRTRADADTLEARRNDSRRRDAAFASGAHAISTDYYLPSTRFDSPYQVSLPNTQAPIRCNPVTAQADCRTYLEQRFKRTAK